MHSSPGNKRLWVCWKEPETAPDPSDSVLTFLLPSAEQRLKVRHPGEVLFGREESLPIRQQARSTYLSISARLAAVPGPGGKTLRQLLSRGGKSSQWWYHPVSFKDCETDPAFDRIIALFTILKRFAAKDVSNLPVVTHETPDFPMGLVTRSGLWAALETAKEQRAGRTAGNQ